MGDAFKSMGTFGKVVAIMMIAGTITNVIHNVSVTVKKNKEAKK